MKCLPTSFKRNEEVTSHTKENQSCASKGTDVSVSKFKYCLNIIELDEVEVYLYLNSLSSYPLDIYVCLHMHIYSYFFV